MSNFLFLFFPNQLVKLLSSCVSPQGEGLRFPEDHWSYANAVLEGGHRRNLQRRSSEPAGQRWAVEGKCQTYREQNVYVFFQKLYDHKQTLFRRVGTVKSKSKKSILLLCKNTWKEAASVLSNVLSLNVPFKMWCTLRDISVISDSVADVLQAVRKHYLTKRWLLRIITERVRHTSLH